MINKTMTALLERYETMCTLSQQMLEAARKEEWDHLVSIADARIAIADYLQLADDVSWQGAAAVRKADVINAMLAADHEIKIRTEAWMNQLQGMLASINTEKKLNKAYE